jgi:hypothetical protein
VVQSLAEIHKIKPVNDCVISLTGSAATAGGDEKNILELFYLCILMSIGGSFIIWAYNFSFD